MHKEFIEREFSKEALEKRIVVLDIPDIYYRGQRELVAMLRKKLEE